jgi:hypothetical protein
VTNEIPLWVAVVIGLGPSVVAVFAIADTNIRDRRRLAHERETWLKDKRIEAYRKMLAATTKAHTERDAVDELFASYVEISLIASTDEIDRAADEVLVRYFQTQKASYRQTQDPEASSGYAPALNKATAARDRFLALTRKELGIKGRTAGFRDLEGATPGNELPDPEESSSGR